jgi:hypothetical protein
VITSLLPEKHAPDPVPSDAKAIRLTARLRTRRRTHEPAVREHVGEEPVLEDWVFGRLLIGDTNSANSEEVLLGRVVPAEGSRSGVGMLGLETVRWSNLFFVELNEGVE